MKNVEAFVSVSNVDKKAITGSQATIARNLGWEASAGVAGPDTFIIKKKITYAVPETIDELLTLMTEAEVLRAVELDLSKTARNIESSKVINAMAMRDTEAIKSARTVLKAMFGVNLEELDATLTTDERYSESFWKEALNQKFGK